MSEPHNNLGDLIDSTRQDAQAQQAKLEAEISKSAAPPRGKQMLSAVLLIVCAVVLYYQYPRFSEPYAWPDPASHAYAVDGNLVEVVGLIETYRIAQGKLPEVLSQVAIPEGLAALMAQSPLLYQPRDQAYTLDWTLANWHASYDSQTEKVNVEPVVKK
jgi:hypothetical protein